MKIITAITTILLLLAHQEIWAYGSSSSASACAKPKFSDFTPPDKSEISEKAGFSFLASPNTLPDSIKVTIKNEPVKVQIEGKSGTSAKISGKLPASLHAGSFARINITGEASNSCSGSDGWLVKIVP